MNDEDIEAFEPSYKKDEKAFAEKFIKLRKYQEVYEYAEKGFDFGLEYARQLSHLEIESLKKKLDLTENSYKNNKTMNEMIIVEYRKEIERLRKEVEDWKALAKNQLFITDQKNRDLEKANSRILALEAELKIENNLVSAIIDHFNNDGLNVSLNDLIKMTNEVARERQKQRVEL